MIEDPNGASVLVTGGAGLANSHIVDVLIEAGAEMIVYDSLIRYCGKDGRAAPLPEF